MDLEEYGKQDVIQSHEIIKKIGDKWNKNQDIKFFEDIFPELKELQGKNYASIDCAGSIKGCEQLTNTNLGLLLGSGLYDNVIFPLRLVPNRKTFEKIYGLSENSGSHINFDQFLHLIRIGKVKIVLLTSPSEYKANFYKQIFDACEIFPIYSGYRISKLIQVFKLFEKAVESGVAEKKNPLKEVADLYPEFTFEGCMQDISKVYSKKFLMKEAISQNVSNYKHMIRWYSTKLLDLRSFGFEKIGDFCLKCAKIDNQLGAYVLDKYYFYLTSPISEDLLSFQNYSHYHVNQMSFFKMIPENLKLLWNDALTSSPLSFSTTGKQIDLQTVELKGEELLKIISDFSDNTDAKLLKKNILKMDFSLDKFDFVEANRYRNKIDEIITESINSEIAGYEKKGKMSKRLLRFGKTFTSLSSNALRAMGTFMAGKGEFEWAMMAFGGSVVPTWGEKKLEDIEPKDITKWWSKKSPFKNNGIGFLIWEKTH